MEGRNNRTNRNRTNPTGVPSGFSTFDRESNQREQGADSPAREPIIDQNLDERIRRQEE